MRYVSLQLTSDLYFHVMTTRVQNVKVCGNNGLCTPSLAIFIPTNTWLMTLSVENAAAAVTKCSIHIYTALAILIVTKKKNVCDGNKCTKCRVVRGSVLH